MIELRWKGNKDPRLIGTLQYRETIRILRQVELGGINYPREKWGPWTDVPFVPWDDAATTTPKNTGGVTRFSDDQEAK